MLCDVCRGALFFGGWFAGLALSSPGVPADVSLGTSLGSAWELLKTSGHLPLSIRAVWAKLFPLYSTGTFLELGGSSRSIFLALGWDPFLAHFSFTSFGSSNGTSDLSAAVSVSQSSLSRAQPIGVANFYPVVDNLCVLWTFTGAIVLASRRVSSVYTIRGELLFLDYHALAPLVVPAAMVHLPS